MNSKFQVSPALKKEEVDYQIVIQKLKKENSHLKGIIKKRTEGS